MRTPEEIAAAIEDLQAAFEHALEIGDNYVVNALPPAIEALRWAAGGKYGSFNLTLRGARLFRRALTESREPKRKGKK